MRGCGCVEGGRRKNRGGEGGGGKQRSVAERNQRQEASSPRASSASTSDLEELRFAPSSSAEREAVQARHTVRSSGSSRRVSAVLEVLGRVEEEAV